MAEIMKRLGRERIMAENEKVRPFLERMVGKKVKTLEELKFFAHSQR